MLSFITLIHEVLRRQRTFHYVYNSNEMSLNSNRSRLLNVIILRSYLIKASNHECIQGTITDGCCRDDMSISSFNHPLQGASSLYFNLQITLAHFLLKIFSEFKKAL